MLICDNRGDGAYCRALQHYIAQQKGTHLDILSCHRIQLFHSRRRNISFMCFKIHQDDALNNQRFYMNLFSQHIVGSAPNGEYELRYGSLPLCLQYIQTDNNMVLQSNRVVYHSPYACDVIVHAIKNKLGYPPKSNYNGANEAVILVVSTETSLNRATEKTTAELSKETDMQLESIIRVSLLDAIEDYGDIEFAECTTSTM